MTADQLLQDACRRDPEFAGKWIYRCDDTPRFQNWKLTLYVPIPEDAPDRSPEACLKAHLKASSPAPSMAALLLDPRERFIFQGGSEYAKRLLKELSEWKP